MPRISFTQHAVERFVERHKPELSTAEARAWLETESANAVRLKERTTLGQMQWKISNPPCILVTKHDRGATFRGPICVTILPARGFGFPDEEQEVIREAELDREAHLARLRELSAQVPPISKAVLQAPIPPVPFAPPTNKRIIQKQSRPPTHTERKKWLEHNVQQENQLRVFKTTLKATVRYLLARAAEGDDYAYALLERLQAIEPDFVKEEFLRVMPRTAS